MPLADEWLMYKPDFNLILCIHQNSNPNFSNQRKEKSIDQIMGDASKSAQMYGSLDEFIPLHIDKLSMAKQREDEAKN